MRAAHWRSFGKKRSSAAIQGHGGGGKSHGQGGQDAVVHQHRHAHAISSTRRRVRDTVA
jgi:hypothetical protein